MRYPDFAHAQSGGPTWTHADARHTVRTYTSELPSRNPEQAGSLPIGHSRKRECPQLTTYIAKLCALVGVVTPDYGGD